MSRPGPAEQLAKARADDSARRRRRVLAALDDLTRDGLTITVSAVARMANVHRSLIYRHSDLHTAYWLAPPNRRKVPPEQVSRQSLLVDLADMTARSTRQAQHIAQLEQRLSHVLGQDAWQATGLGAPTDIGTLQEKITRLEQQVAELISQLGERDEDLAAARTTNRELTTQLNSHFHRPR